MADISIPGVSNKYRSNETVEGLMKIERIPLTREQETLELYETQQVAWRDINQRMSELRSSAKSLYSFENPFNNKLADSSDERAVTAEPGRDASFGSFKIDVIAPATADRFISDESDKKATVPAGVYSYQIGEKTVSMKWKGGKLADFVTSLNKRGGKNLKASLVNVNSDKQSLLLESLVTGKENRIIFKDDALSYAIETGMLQKSTKSIITFAQDKSELSLPKSEQIESEQGLPELSLDGVEERDGKSYLAPRSAIEIKIPDEILADKDSIISFSVLAENLEHDITENLQAEPVAEEIDEGAFSEPELPPAGSITFSGVTIFNNPANTFLDEISEPEEMVQIDPIFDDSFVFLKSADGTETFFDISQFPIDSETGETQVSFPLKDYPDTVSIIIRNRNTGRSVAVSPMKAEPSKKDDFDYEPVHPITEAADAVFKYEGITITRASNSVDDVIPHVTLHINEATEKTATINIKPDKEAAKNALITFIGKYNQTLAEMNILSQNKPELIAELEYLSDDEKESETKKLGLFQSDYSLSSGKTSLQRALSGNYPYSDDAEITMLSQIGISTNASGAGGGYNASQIRGYLEVDEKKLDSSLENHLDAIKNLFGYDSDGDLIIDSGIGFLVDKQMAAWVQSGGLIASRTATLDTKIQSSKKKIATLETQLKSKESELKRKYAQMEGSLNSLQSQSTSIDNTFNRNSN